MALENVMRVDGGHIVTGGGAGGSSVEIDWEDWCELTPEEQETGDWTIINCPWADGNVSVDLMTKLWENPNPAANFAAQSSQIDLTGYEYVMAISTVGLISIAKNVVGNYINLNEAGSASGGTIIRRRLGIITSTGISWEAAYQSSSWSAGSADNSLIKPYQIFGIKLTATVKINAIAMDVSTSADKCMLSENESVKDRLDAHTIDNDYPDISSYIYNNGTYNDYTAPSDGYVVFKYSANSEGGMLIKTDENNHMMMATTKELVQSVFVKKGTQFCFGSTPSIGRFYSFI